MRQLLRFIAPYKGLLFVCVVLILALTVIQIGIPYLSKMVIDNYMTPPLGIVSLSESPSRVSSILLGDGRYLVDLRLVDRKTRQVWEAMGVLSRERYLFVAEDSSRASIAMRNPQAFTPVSGGYLADQELLRKIPSHDLVVLRGTAIAGVTRIAGLFVFALLVRFLFGAFQVYLLQLVGQKVMYDMRQQIFAHVLRLPVSYFDHTPVGRLVTRVTNDVAAINEMFTSMLVNLFRDSFLIIGVLAIMFGLEWRLAFIILALFPIIVFAAFQFRNRVRNAYREVRRQIAKLNAYLQESISGMRIVQVFVQERAANKRFMVINRDKYLASMKQMVIFAVFRPLMSFLSSFAVALVVWYGGLNVLGGGLSLGALTALIQYVRMLFEPILELSEGYNVLQGAMAAAERIFFLLEEPEEKHGEGKSLAHCRGKIEFRDVWFAYNEGEWVLKGVSFSAAPGERIAIVGLTGSGKTTIIRLLLRMYPIQKGEILLDGIPIEQLELSFLRSQMAVVLQDVFLFSGNIMDNVRLRADISEEEVVKATRFVSADFVENLPDKYHTEVKERGVTLSVGQRQLLSFARAVVVNPRVLVLDEATASIDSHTESLIQNSLGKIMSGRTSIVVAHRLSTIRESNRIVVLHKGRIVEQGNHHQLLAQDGLYAALHSFQFGEGGENLPG